MKLEVCFSQSNGLKYLDGKLGPLIRSIEAKAQCNKIVVTDIKKTHLTYVTIFKNPPGRLLKRRYTKQTIQNVHPITRDPGRDS